MPGSPNSIGKVKNKSLRQPTNFAVQSTIWYIPYVLHPLCKPSVAIILPLR
jgi:hypothetical protein